MSEPIIRAEGLSKSFWRRTQRQGMLGAMRGLVDRSGTEVHAVSQVSFEIPAGEIVGYIGPNGADGIRGRWLGGGDPQTFVGEFAAFEVDRSALDAAPAHVDPEGKSVLSHLVSLV